MTRSTGVAHIIISCLCVKLKINWKLYFIYSNIVNDDVDEDISVH